MPIEPHHVYKPAAADLSERADQHIERELLAVENDRLRKENATLRGALKAAGRVIGPYIDPHNGRRRGARLINAH
jgi:hypothetical protein